MLAKRATQSRKRVSLAGSQRHDEIGRGRKGKGSAGAGARESRGISCVVGESLVTVHLLKELAALLFQRARGMTTTTTRRIARYTAGGTKVLYVLSKNGRAERRDLRASERRQQPFASVAASSRSKLPRSPTPRRSESIRLPSMNHGERDSPCV